MNDPQICWLCQRLFFPEEEQETLPTCEECQDTNLEARTWEPPLP